MVKKDKNYRNFNNRTAFNGRPLMPGQILVPAVLNREMKETLKPAGLNYDYAESWHFPHAKEVVPVVFIPTEDVPGALEGAMKFFNCEATRYLKHIEFGPEDGILSLDEFLDNIDDEDGKGYDPTGTTENEEIAALTMVLNMLISDLAEMNAIDGEIFKLHTEGYERKDIISMVNIGKGKTQAYEYIGKVIKRAEELYYKKYSDK